jgi:hypothetical protein
VAKYGIKLLHIELRNNTGSIPRSFVPPKGPTYLQRVVNDFDVRARSRLQSEAEAAANEAVLTTADAESGDHVQIAADDVVSGVDEATLPTNARKTASSVVRIDEIRQLESALLLRIQYGLVGDHPLAVDPDGLLEDTDLSGLATTRAYRALIIAPSQGNVGLLAVEVISGSHAGKDLPRRLHNAAVGHNLKIKVNGPIADESAVRNLVRRGRVSEVELFKTIATSDAADPKLRRVKLTFPIAVGASEAGRILEVATRWLPPLSMAALDDENYEPEILDPEIEAAALASLLWHDSVGLAFDDARVRIVSPSNTRRLAPLNHSEGFIYEIGDEEADDDEFVQRVAAIAQPLFAANAIDIDDTWSTWSDVDNSEIDAPSDAPPVAQELSEETDAAA